MGTAVGQLRFRGTSLLLRLPTSPVGKSHCRNNKNIQGNKPHNVPEAIPSKKRKQDEELHDGGHDDGGHNDGGHDDGGHDDGIDDKDDDYDDDVDYDNDDDADTDDDIEGVNDHMEVETANRASVAGGIDVLSDSDFGSNDSNHGYSIATHFVKVQSSGTLADVKSLWQLAGTDAVSQSVKILLEHTKPGVQRFSSIHAFEKVTDILFVNGHLVGTLTTFIKAL